MGYAGVKPMNIKGEFKMLTTDLDGTLISYSSGSAPAFNHALAAQWKAEGVAEIAIATNQGGILFADGKNKFPTAEIVASRIIFAAVELSKYNIKISKMIISVYHPKFKHGQISADLISRPLLNAKKEIPSMQIETGEQWRKPSPKMLQAIKATNCYGDSDEDKAAAEAANIPFHKVERFQ